MYSDYVWKEEYGKMPETDTEWKEAWERLSQKVVDELKPLCFRKASKSRYKDQDADTLRERHGVEWDNETMGILNDFIAKGFEFTQDTVIQCRCGNAIQYSAKEYMRHMMDNTGKVCQDCVKAGKMKSLRWRCKIHGFSEYCAELRWKNWDVEKPEQKELLAIAKQYVKTSPLKSLYVKGMTGVGKTRWVETIGVNLLEKGLDVHYVGFEDLIQEGKKNKSTEERCKHRILIVDDFHIARGFPFTDYVMAILLKRYKSGNPTIITTNIPVSELGQPGMPEPVQKFHSRLSDNVYQVVLFKITEDLRGYYAKR